MIKALLMVTSISLGNVDTVLPSMKDCMEARDAIIQQDAETKVLCVPYTMEQSKSDDMRDMFSVFMEMIVQLKSYEENYGVWEKRIDNANLALSRCQDKDMKKYWTRVVKTLLRKSKQKLN